MSLKYALLGFLNYAAMTGYELKQHFDNSIQHFWNANLSQIYPTLSQMEKEGLLAMEVEYQENRPNRKVYKITDTGRQDLIRWLGEPQKMHTIRNPFLVQVFFGAQLDKEKIMAILNHQHNLYRQKLESYRQIKDHLSRRPVADSFKRDAVFWELTLDSGIKFMMALLEWLEEAIKKTEKALEENKGGV